MTIEMTVGVQLDYGLAGTSDILLQIEAAADVPGQRVLDEKIEMPLGEHMARIPGEDGLGTRVWLRSDGPLTVSYQARVAVDRVCPDFAGMAAVPPHQLGAEPTRYLLPSRFCPSDRFQSFVAHEFPGLGGGALVQAALDWIAGHLTYVPGSSGPRTGADQTFLDREGICRDYAHLLVSFLRAGGIPARVASVFGLGVTPQDFHAVVEVWVDGAWHLADPTGMSSADRMAVIGVGRDAADIAFLTCFGRADLMRQVVEVSEG
ncbi:MAG: transglutaminase family protein [Pseudomonadota bacterium]|nr:transglutaminase family protein [Pseudomonadota bacterium]